MRVTLVLRATFASIILALAPTAAGAGPAMVVDIASGHVLAHREAFQRWHPASLTKLMTAYVAFRAVKAGEMTMTSGVRISRRAAEEPPSKMSYRPGSVLTLDNALKIIMVKSANDVATAIAENVAGSVDAFAARMNAEAKRLGMTDSHFVNAHGLHSPQQYTSARDMAILAVQLRREFPEHASYFSIEALQADQTLMPNYNMLIGRFTGADGMKTGFICASGFNLAASATRDGRTLMAIVLGAASQSERAEEAAEMLARGFSAPTDNAPRLAGLQPYGENRLSPVDMRSRICSQDAQKARVAARGEGGKVIVNSPYLPEPSREPIAVPVTLGGASDPGRLLAEPSRVPVPTPRPEYSAAAKQGDGR